jgi:dihydrofolate reductase
LRKITYGGAASLDGYLARKDDGMDWLLWSDELRAEMGAYWDTIDTILMGRRTYEVSRKMGGHGSHLATYVFSRTLSSVADSGVRIISADATDFVRNLKSSAGKDICLMGGGVLARSLFEEGLIDEVGFNIHPILLGSGVPALPPMSQQVKLELVKSRTLGNGCVLLTYRVKHTS